MKPWPRSLLGRGALLVAGIVILGQVISALALYFIYLDARLERTAAMIATEVETVGHALETMTPAQRERYIEALKAGLDIQVILLLAGVSHDLRSLWARLRLALEMLGDKADATLQQGMVQDIDDMDRIVEQFLAYVRDGDIESVRQTDLNELVRSTAARYQRQGHHVGLDLTSLPPLALRATAMQRLLSNLVHTRLNNETILLSVLGRGPGLSASEPGVAQRSRLGLIGAERIAQLHRSKLQLLPREGGGLEARVELALPSLKIHP